MQLTPLGTRSLVLARNGGSASVASYLGAPGPQGPPGPGSAAWAAGQAVIVGTVREAPDGSRIKSTASRTTGSSFDATEQTFWTAVAATPGTIEAAALIALAARLVGVQAVATANGALVPMKHNPVDATSGNRTMTLADATDAGQMVVVSKKDSSANTVTISVSHLRDGGAGSIVLVGQYEAITLTSKADGSWWPIGDHKTKAYFDATYHSIATTGTGIYKNADPTTKPAYTIGNAPNSGGWPGTGTPAGTPGALAVYQDFGDKVGGSNTPIPKSTQAIFIVGSYYGPTSEDSAEAGSSSVVLHNTSGSPYTQALQTVAWEGTVHVDPNVTCTGQVTGIVGRVEMSGSANDVIAVRASAMAEPTSTGTITRYVAFGQMSSPARGTIGSRYGVYVVDPVASETSLVLGKSGVSASWSAKLLGNSDGQKSMVLMNLPTVSEAGSGGVMGLRIVAASDQTKNLQQWWGLGDAAAGAASLYVDKDALFNTKKGVAYRGFITDPSAPGASEARVYLRDNGSGLGELVARFNTGTIKKIATEAPADPGRLGLVGTFTPGVTGTQAAWRAANEARYAVCVAGGTISKIGFHVASSSGNVSVAVHRKSGSGRTGVPGTQVASSGSVACPIAGYAEVALGSTVTVEPGDFLAMSCDNTTATFTVVSNLDSDLYKGFGYRATASHPLPASVGTLTASTDRMPLLIGV